MFCSLKCGSIECLGQKSVRHGGLTINFISSQTQFKSTVCLIIIQDAKHVFLHYDRLEKTNIHQYLYN